MKRQKIELTNEDIKAIKLSERQFARGEGICSKEVVAQVRRMYARNKKATPKVTLTAEDLAGIKEAEKQIERGDFVEFSKFAARMRRKYGIRQSDRPKK